MSEKRTIKLTKSEAKRLEIALDLLACELASKMAKEVCKGWQDKDRRKLNRGKTTEG